MKKLKAIFLSENDTKIDYVYSPEQQKLIAELTDLIPERLCSRNFDSMDLSELEVSTRQAQPTALPVRF